MDPSPINEFCDRARRGVSRFKRNLRPRASVLGNFAAELRTQLRAARGRTTASTPRELLLLLLLLLRVSFCKFPHGVASAMAYGTTRLHPDT